METVKQHFEAEAQKFDRLIRTLIPCYMQMLEALIQVIPFERHQSIRALDLGSGTGTVAGQVLQAFPNAQVTCIDFAENMIEMARSKLAAHQNVRYLVQDFSTLPDDAPFHLIVSSLALHHIPTDHEKKDFYQKVHERLERGGCFYNADVVLSSAEHLQQVYLAQWKAFMRRTLSEHEVDDWIARYQQEDRPSELLQQLEWLREIGFTAVDVPWKHYNFAVYGGQKG